jgi:hypothetical protein
MLLHFKPLGRMLAASNCHANGHVNGATHLDPHTRPQDLRRRLDVPTLRGVNIQRLFGSQRSLRSLRSSERPSCRAPVSTARAPSLWCGTGARSS